MPAPIHLPRRRIARGSGGRVGDVGANCLEDDDGAEDERAEQHARSKRSRNRTRETREHPERDDGTVGHKLVLTL